MNENKIKVNQEIFTVVLTDGDSGLFPAENQVRMMLGHSGEEVSEELIAPKTETRQPF